MTAATEEVQTPEKPGFYRDVDFDTYAAWDAANASLLNHFRRTAEHALHYINTGGRERTRSLELGWLLHLAVFEPERYKSEVVVAPKVDRRTKVGKATWAEFTANHPHALYADMDTMGAVKAMRESLFSHQTARLFLEGVGHNEISALWNDRDTGAPCKARVDRVAPINEWPVVGDLKTTWNAERRSFERSIEKYGYDVSAAHYLDGLETIVPIPNGNPFRRFFFFVVENEPPYCTAVYEITEEALVEGKRKRDRYLRQWVECRETGVWPGYPQGVDYVSLPPWAFKNYIDD